MNGAGVPAFGYGSPGFGGPGFGGPGIPGGPAARFVMMPPQAMPSVVYSMASMSSVNSTSPAGTPASSAATPYLPPPSPPPPLKVEDPELARLCRTVLNCAPGDALTPAIVQGLLDGLKLTSPPLPNPRCATSEYVCFAAKDLLRRVAANAKPAPANLFAYYALVQEHAKQRDVQAAFLEQVDPAHLDVKRFLVSKKRSSLESQAYGRLRQQCKDEVSLMYRKATAAASSCKDEDMNLIVKEVFQAQGVIDGLESRAPRFPAFAADAAGVDDAVQMYLHGWLSGSNFVTSMADDKWPEEMEKMYLKSILWVAVKDAWVSKARTCAALV